MIMTMRGIRVLGLSVLLLATTGSGVAIGSTRGHVKLPSLHFDRTMSQKQIARLGDGGAGGGGPGPYYHDVYVASSRDGLHFANGRLLIEHASVPDGVRLPSGRLVVYAVDGVPGRSKHALMVGVSDDNGAHWKVGSLQMPGVRPGQYVDPDAVLLPDGKVRLFAMTLPTPPPGSTKMPPNKMLSFISSDGVTFHEEPGVRFQYHGLITDPDVVEIGNTWFAYFKRGNGEIIAKSADDGRTFAYSGVLRTSGGVSDTIAIGGGRYRQYYCSTQNGDIVSAITTNGTRFKDEPGARITPPSGQGICDPSALPAYHGTTLLFYKVIVGPGTAGQPSQNPGGCPPAPQPGSPSAPGGAGTGSGGQAPGGNSTGATTGGQTQPAPQPGGSQAPQPAPGSACQPPTGAEAPAPQKQP